MAHFLLNNSIIGIEFTNSRTIERCGKRFLEKYSHPIVIYTPLLPNVAQTFFLLGFTLISTAVIIIAIIALFLSNGDVRMYFSDMTKKLRTCGKYSDNPEEMYGWNDDIHAVGQPAPSPRGPPPQQLEEENNKIGTGLFSTHDIFNDMPSTSLYHNFDRRHTVVRMHLPFAHDLASFISMVDGKI